MKKPDPPGQNWRGQMGTIGIVDPEQDFVGNAIRRFRGVPALKVEDGDLASTAMTA